MLSRRTSGNNANTCIKLCDKRGTFKSLVRTFHHWSTMEAVAASIGLWPPSICCDANIRDNRHFLYNGQLFFLSSSFTSVTRLSTLLSPFSGFLVTERLCFLYVDSSVSCKFACQFDILHILHRQPRFPGYLNLMEYSDSSSAAKKWCLAKLQELYTTSSVV